MSAPGWELIVGHRNLDRALVLLARLAGELGLSPASRPRIHPLRRRKLGGRLFAERAGPQRLGADALPRAPH
jgi:hypothetical protein